MCGRFVLRSPPRYLAPVFSARYGDDLEEWPPSWNIAPTRSVLGISTAEDGRTISAYRWGLVPSWAKHPSIGARAFNARAETAAVRPMFRAAIRARRLIVPADGFYEWSAATGGGRQPHYFTGTDGAPLALAAMYETWRDDANGGDVLRTCTILTTASGPDVSGIHERQPVVLTPEHRDAWLDPGLSERAELESILVPSPEGTLVAHRVGSAVGRASFDSPELIVST